MVHQLRPTCSKIVPFDIAPHELRMLDTKRHAPASKLYRILDRIADLILHRAVAGPTTSRDYRSSSVYRFRTPGFLDATWLSERYLKWVRGRSLR